MSVNSSCSLHISPWFIWDDFFTGGSVIMDNWLVEHLFKGTSVVVLRVERATPARDSNSQPFVYESNSLTIKPRLPHTSIFKQKPTQISRVKQSKNQHYLPIQKNKQRNRGVWIHALPAPWDLSTAGKPPRYFYGTYLLPDHNSSFNVLFLLYFPLFYLPSLSIYSRSANIHPVHSNWVLSSLYHYKTCSLLPIGYKWVVGLSPML